MECMEPMKVDLDDLRGFVVVAELGSFHAAADSLHLSQPALTRRLQKLEATLGVQLVDRNSRQLRLSSVGRDFFFKAKRLLDELDSAVLGIRELADQTSGEVTIARGADCDLLFPAASYRGLQLTLSPDPNPHSRPLGERCARGRQARPSRVRHQPARRAGARSRVRAIATRAVPIGLPERSCAGAPERSAGPTSHPIGSSRSGGSAATGLFSTRR